MRKFIFSILLFFIVTASLPTFADDYDDGIDPGDGIHTGNNDLQKVTNMRFYNAKVRAKTYRVRKQNNSDSSIAQSNSGGGVNIASPTIDGPVHGDVIIQLNTDDINILQGK
ncbi:hypothetical protein [Maridesulfovibrio bastinii]|uniref:hypothetical protein n=1 Tax=Maridesulfovibrio bastinii TaxID=47157 RepID=UPI00041D2766|nr:hypothetical protein [Maridesulfovibrio bastinii]